MTLMMMFFLLGSAYSYYQQCHFSQFGVSDFEHGRHRGAAMENGKVRTRSGEPGKGTSF